MYGKQNVVQVLLGEGATVNQLGGEVSSFKKYNVIKPWRHFRYAMKTNQNSIIVTFSSFCLLLLLYHLDEILFLERRITSSSSC